MYTVEDVRVVAWEQLNKASMTSDKRMVGTPVVEHGKQRWRTVNGTPAIERTFYQRFWFQRRRSGTAKSLIHKSRRHQSFDPRCTLSRASRGCTRHVFLVYYAKRWFAGGDSNAGLLLSRQTRLSLQYQ